MPDPLRTMAKQIDLIIPVYNCEQFLAGMIEMLKKQTFQDFRVIFVDDGSKDGSYALLERLLPDSGLSYLLLHQENGGAGAARNAGMRQAEAEWIAFADCDDRILPWFLEYFHQALMKTGADLAICSLEMIPEGTAAADRERDALRCTPMTPREAMRLYTEHWLGSCCLCFRRELQVRDRIFYDEQCLLCEDAPFIAEIIAGANAAVKIENRTYQYVLRAGSRHRSPQPEKFRSSIDGILRVEQRLKALHRPAADDFVEYGILRFLLATVRRAAVQMPYGDFLVVCKAAPMECYRQGLSSLSRKMQLACKLYFASPWLFYRAMRLLFRD